MTKTPEELAAHLRMKSKYRDVLTSYMWLQVAREAVDFMNAAPIAHEPNTPIHTEASTCANCGDPIYFVQILGESNWFHLTDMSNYRVACQKEFKATPKAS